MLGSPFYVDIELTQIASNLASKWEIDETAKEKLIQSQQYLEKKGDSKQILTFYDVIKAAWYNTKNGTVLHGHYVDLMKLCDDEKASPRFSAVIRERRVMRQAKSASPVAPTPNPRMS